MTDRERVGIEVACPTCGVVPNVSCVSRTGRMHAHRIRTGVLQQAAREAGHQIAEQLDVETLRDRFAGLAMQALIALGGRAYEQMARDAYHYADVMLKERGR